MTGASDDGQAGVAEADRATAMEALGYGTAAYKLLPESVQWDIDAIAAALAAEREKARAPFLAELDGWEAESRAWYYEHRYDDTGIEYASGYEDGWDAAGKRIRRAAEES